MSKTLCVVAAALLLMTMSTTAHHAFAAEYDENKRVTVSGTVTKFQWTNPHAWLYVDGKDESGKVSNWSFEMGSPNGLIHRGWRRAESKKGDEVTVGRVWCQGGQQCGQRPHRYHARRPEAIRGFPIQPRCPVK